MKKTVLLIFISISILILSDCNNYVSDNYVTIGNYEKTSYSEISKKLGSLFNVEVSYIYSKLFEKDKIIYQFPYAGKEILKGDNLILYLSRGVSPEGLDIEGLTIEEAKKLLDSKEISYSVTYAYNISVKKNLAFGLEEKDGKYTLYISNGKPELIKAGSQGYAVKAGGYTFFTDNEHIWKMNSDGTKKETLVDISEISSIITYEKKDLLIYNKVDNHYLYSFNYKTHSEKLLATNALGVVAIIDDSIIYYSDNGLIKMSLNSLESEYMTKSTNNIIDCCISGDKIFYIERYAKGANEYNCRILSIDYITGEEKQLTGINGDVYNLNINDNKIFYSVYGDGLYTTDIVEGNSKRIIETGDGYYNFEFLGDWIFYQTDSYYDINFYILNLKSGKVEKIENGGLLGIDHRGGWSYYYQGGRTYRLNSENGIKEYFFDQVLAYWAYEKLSFVDDWIYYFNTDYFLCRINNNTKQNEIIIDKPISMPWWGRT